jgi:Spy/CpxP family protein refolding chaperone
MRKTAMMTALVLSLGVSMPQVIFAHEDMTPAEREKKLDKFAKDLDLTQDQKNQVRDIKEDKHRKIEDAEKEANDKIRAVLNPEQQVKFDKMMTDKHE